MKNNKIYDTSLFSSADFKAARVSWVKDLCGDEQNNSPSIKGMQELLRMRDCDSESLRSEMNRGADVPILFGENAPTASGELKLQYDRVLRLTLPFGTVGCRGYHSEELLADILLALDWLHDNMYGANVVTDTSFRSWREYDWWDWYVGAACPLMDVLMIIEDSIPPTLTAKYVTPVAFLSDKMRTAPNAAEAMSRIVTLTPLALITEDRALLQTLFEECEMLLEAHDSGDNMRRDFCCMTHGLPYNVTYGLINLSRIGKVVQILSRSPLAYPLKDLDNLKGMLRYTFAPVMYRGRTLAPMNGRAMQYDNSAATILRETHYLYGLFGEDFDREINRLIRRNGSQQVREQLISTYDNCTTLEEYRKINSFPGTRAAECPKTNICAYARFYDALTNEEYAASSPDYAYMWYSGDICVQHRHDSMIGLRMPSVRSIAYESMNGDNDDGWYTGDGALYLYTPTGFDEYSPAWWQGADKHLIPGTTVEDRQREVMFIGCGWRPRRDFVGGVCLDEKFLTATMDYESFHNEYDAGIPDTGSGRSLPVYHCTLTAKKSYFFFDRAILCMGSDVCAKDGYPVHTVIENRALEGEEYIVADGKRINFTESELSLAAQRIFIPHTGGFIFPEGGDLKVRFYQSGGVRFVSIRIDHGVDPEGEKYAYILLPNATEDDTLAYDAGDVVILRNDGKIQAAKEKSSGLCGIVFREACEIEGITAEQPMIAMLRRDGQTIRSLTVCEPTQRLERFSFTVNDARHEIVTDSARGRSYSVEI
ncbi:MAG: hypothetical protein IJY39_01305 [Clostridia bacterium]|nr:hypothetical protein [Clostridia bacterium]